MLSPYFVVALLVLLESSAQGTMKVHESRSAIPQGFIYQGTAPPQTFLNMRIALKQPNPAGLEEILMAVSTPGNPTYGQHLTKEEVETFVTPPQDVTDTVTAFLQDNGITSTKLTSAGDWLGFQLTVGEANNLFKTNYSIFKHQTTGVENIVSMEYSLPANLSEYVRLVHPTTSFDNAPLMNPERSADLVLNAVPVGDCITATTPVCLAKLYGIPTAPATVSTNKLGVSGFANNFANQADLNCFLSNFRVDANANVGFTLQTLDGGANSQSGSSASPLSNLDLQYTVGIATNVPTTFISVGSHNQDGTLLGLLDLINFLNEQTNPPQVVVISSGLNEDDISSTVAQSFCTACMQLSARGVSIILASGDGGVAGTGDTSTGQCASFTPTFPSGCPFLTSVGSTTNVPETAASFSSGGFSNIFSRPSYQSAAVLEYLEILGNNNAGRFNPNNRGYPDVSALGTNFEIIVANQLGLVSGTPASGSVFASIIALINDRLAAAGKAPLGFLNPLLYSNAACLFNDITTGSNPGCGTNGFPAEAGWDPVTGLGTPNFTAILTAAERAAGL